MSTRTVGTVRLSSNAALSPLKFGMAMSSTATSGVALHTSRTAVGGLPDDDKPAFLEQRAQPLSDKHMIVGENETEWHG
jgi:hypothetical protein